MIDSGQIVDAQVEVNELLVKDSIIMREYFNRFQRIRKRLDDLQRQYVGTGSGANDIASGASNYFNGCNSLESLQKRYKDLCKVYHPDMGNGSAEIFTEIQAAYENLKKKYE